MDYRYYREDGIELPPAIQKRIYLLRPIGALMAASPPILAFLMIFDLLEPSLFWFFASFLLGIFGNVFFMIGMTYDTFFDRGGGRILRRCVNLFGRGKSQKAFREGRRMIYEHYETPECINNKEGVRMTDTHAIEALNSVLGQFQDGYKERDLDRLDEFMTLFAQEGSVELIGIGAFERGGAEWFEGLDKIKEIIQSDWTYWGDVEIDVDGAKISVNGDTAWLTTTGTLEQTDTFDKAMPFYLNQMKEIIESEEKGPDEKLIEATHFGMRRLRERLKGGGHKWPFVISAVLVREDGKWRFHTIHWSMPVD